jgi:hypothetical protein
MKDLDQLIESAVSSKKQKKGISLDLNMLLEMVSEVISEEKGDNLKAAIEAVEGEGYEHEVKGNTIKILDDNRQDAFDKMQDILGRMGFEHNPLMGGSLGRLQKLDRTDGNVYVLFKPKSRTRAATAGMDYEEKLAAAAKELGLEASTAGAGHGSDLTLTGDKEEVKVEVKTTLSADFGQFTAQYDPASGTWETRKTKQFLKNAEIFQPLFDDYLVDYLNQNCKLPVGDPRLQVSKRDRIYGIRPSLTTGELKRELDNEWFDGKSDYKVAFDFDRIDNYYADKGDEYIQVGNKGLYALTPEAAEKLGVPLFSESGLGSYMRFRIKPHAGRNGRMSFTTAVKLFGKLKPSNLSLNNPEDIQKIKNIL